MIIAFLLLTCPLPWTESRVDVIELNHVYDAQAERRLSQVIFWRDGHVAAWCHVRDAGAPRMVGGQWRVEVRYRGTWYRVQAPSYRETWTQWDPEVLDREEVHELRREGL